MLTFFSLPYLFKRKIVKVGFKFFRIGAERSVT